MNGHRYGVASSGFGYSEASAASSTTLGLSPGYRLMAVALVLFALSSLSNAQNLPEAFSAQPSAMRSSAIDQPTLPRPYLAAGARTAQRIELPKLTPDELALLADPRAVGGRKRVGIWRDIPQPLPAMNIQTTASANVTYHEVMSPGAASLRAEIASGALPPGTLVNFFGPNDEAIGALTIESEQTAANSHWSPRVPGDSVTIEVIWPPAATPVDASTWLARVSHRTLREPAVAAVVDCDSCVLGQPRSIGASASCQVDSVCEADWQSEANGVARMVYEDGGASFTCTGTLLNTTVSDFTPYFVSANHCFSTQAAASTLITDWFFEASACSSGQLSPASVTLNGGATLLTADVFTDTILLRLNDAPPPGAVYQGWTLATPAVGQSIKGIHHPSGDLKKITTGQILEFRTCNDLTAPEGYFCVSGAATDAESQFIAAQWSVGATETGSSGSSLFLDDSRQIIGIQLGGSDSCSNREGASDYGRFERAYQRNNWGQWLAPAAAATYEVSVSQSGTGYASVTSSPAGIDCGSTCNAAFAAGTELTLSITVERGTVFQGWSGACTGTATSCSVSVNNASAVTYSLASDTSVDSDGDAIPDDTDPYPSDGGNSTSEREAVSWLIGEIYLASLGRAMDSAGLAYWVNEVNTKAEWTPAKVAQSFFEQPEVQALYPPSSTTAEFVTALYQNVLGRDPDAAGLEYWVTQIDSNAVRRDQMVIAMINGAWDNPRAFRNGDVARFRNRAVVAKAFSDYQSNNGIESSQLSASERDQLRAASREVLVGVTADSATVASAIARIPSLLGIFLN